MDCTRVLASILCLLYLTDRVFADVDTTRHRAKRQTEVLDAFCSERVDGQIYPDPSSCRSYIFCSGGYGYRSTCAGDLYYNPAVQTCDFDAGKCRGQEEKSALISERNKLIPTSATSPILNRANFGDDRSTNVDKIDEFPRKQLQFPRDSEFEENRAPTDIAALTEPGLKLVADPSRLQGVADSGRRGKLGADPESRDGPDPLPSVEELIARDKQRLLKVEQELKTTLASICSDKADGTYAHPSDCHSYVYCSNGLAFPATCPDSLIYNSAFGGCDFDIDGLCTKTTFPADYTPSSDTPTPRRFTDPPRLSTVPDVFNQIPESIPEELTLMMPDAIERAMTSLTQRLQDEADLAKRQTGSNRPFKLVQQFLSAKPLAKQLSLPAYVLNRASQELVDELGMNSPSGAMVLQSLISPLPPSSHRLQSDDPFPPPEPGSCPWPRYNCRVGKYRSADGSCNNLHSPLTGRAFTPFKRFLPAVYANGMSTMRESVLGGSLPGARRVSAAVAQDRDVPHHLHTVMLMQWGQFVDHDLTLTAISKLVTEPTGYGRTDDIECGVDGCSTDNEACLPISIPDSDPAFYGKTCLEFVRSQEVPNINCTMGPREQLNQITSYLDGSNVYGSTAEDAANLRDSDPDRGSLRYTIHPSSANLKHLLPQTTEDKECKTTDTTHQCFVAGDERVNEQNALTVMHTVWLREHNRIEAELREVNPQWDGDTLYQETRRIVGAMLQHITFNEFLPTVLGPRELRKHDLELITDGYFGGYNSSTEAGIANVFASAAFRFGHTLIPKEIKRANSSFHSQAYPAIKLNQMFFRPKSMYNTDEGGVDGFLRGMSEQRVQTYDRFITKEVTTRLFTDTPPEGLGTDLVSLNIMRARDHGIPGYNAWREWCGLRTTRTFEDLLDTMEMEDVVRFKNLYNHVDDIDLFVAGISERPVQGGLIGPTFSCIIGRQFRDLRQGDRFWYENNGANRFSPEQLAEIRKTTLARVICSNSDDITQIQPRVMELPFREAYPNRQYPPEVSGLGERWYDRLWVSDYNKRAECSCLPALDLTHWRE